MNYLKQALTEYLSGLTTKKNEKEIWIKDEYWGPITVEPIDDENYIIRRYYKDGQLWWEGGYKNNKWHGVYKVWGYEKLEVEEIYEDGRCIKVIKNFYSKGYKNANS